jgi:hypothetical protein
MVVCLLRNPDPAGLASCAQLPLEQRSPCAFQYFLEQACRNEPDLAAMEACWARERARLGVPG